MQYLKISLLILGLFNACYSQVSTHSFSRRGVFDSNKDWVSYAEVIKESKKNKIFTQHDFRGVWEQLDSKKLKTQLIAACSIIENLKLEVKLKQFVMPNKTSPQPPDYYEFRVKEFKSVVASHLFQMNLLDRQRREKKNKLK